MFDNILGFLVQALIAVVILGALWLGLRLIFRFTMRIFSFGCAIIVFMGACFLLFRIFF
jgi:hypothetical protein